MPGGEWNPSTRQFNETSGPVATVRGTATKMVTTPAATKRRFQLEDEWLKKNKQLGGKLSDAEKAAQSAYVNAQLEKEFPSKPPAAAETQAAAVATAPATSKPAEKLSVGELAKVQQLMDAGMTREEAVRKVRPPAATQANALK